MFLVLGPQVLNVDETEVLGLGCFHICITPLDLHVLFYFILFVLPEQSPSEHENPYNCYQAYDSQCPLSDFHTID